MNWSNFFQIWAAVFALSSTVLLVGLLPASEDKTGRMARRVLIALIACVLMTGTCGSIAAGLVK